MANVGIRTALGAAAACLTWLCAGPAAHATGPVEEAPPQQQMMAPGADRVALVIANADHPGIHLDLRNAHRDGRLVADALRDVGFEVDVVEELSRDEMLDALDSFRQARASNADVAVVYFAGVGIEVNGINYLAGTDLADFSSRSQAEVLADMASVPDLVDAVRQARSFGMVMADAGRDNPFAPASARGLAAPAPLEDVAYANDVLIFYSSAEGELASDGEGDNGPFAEAVAEHMGEPGLEIGLFTRRVRASVVRATDGRQTPSVYGELSDREFYFVPQAAPPAPARPAEPTLVLSSQPRLALVLGNGDYNRDGDYADDRYSAAVTEDGFAPDLPNAVNDASDIRDALARIGFDVDFAENTDRAAMSSALFSFEQKLQAAGPDAIVLIYYAGHAIQVNGANYLVPVDAKLPSLDFTRMTDAQTEFELSNYAIPINLLYDRLKNPSSKGLNLIVLDACRENPWESRGIGRSVSGSGGDARGLADIRIQLRRTAIAYATKPGDVAADGGGRNSPYTAVLKDWIGRPGVNVRDLFDSVAGAVETATDGQQSPWMNAPYLGDTCLGPCPAAQPG